MSGPRVTYMEEDGSKKTIHLDDLPDMLEPVANEDYFKSVKLSGKAIDQASKIVKQEFWLKENEGLHTWLQKRADFVFSKLSTIEREGRLRTLKYVFEYDADGPVLKSVIHMAI